MRRRTRHQAEELRDEARSLSPKWQNVPLTNFMASGLASLPGWNGQPVEPWRISALNVFNNAARTVNHPSIDWLEGEVNIDLMLFQSASLVKFWLHDVELRRMPRHWLRWAFEMQQRFHRVIAGTPVDAQISCYRPTRFLLV